MNLKRGNVNESSMPGYPKMDTDWMASFWSVFTDSIFILNPDLIITNLKSREDSTINLGIITGKNFIDLVAPTYKDVCLENFNYIKHELNGYIRFPLKLNNERYYRFTFIPIIKSEVLVSFNGVCVDITENTLKEITLNWQRSVIETGGDFIRIFDTNGNILYSNPGVYLLTGYPINSNPSSKDLYSIEHYKKVYDIGLKEVEKNGVWISRGNIIRFDGTVIPINHKIIAIYDENSKLVNLATIITDITSDIEHEKKLEHARKAAETASYAKSEFLSRMSHEIRTPMNAILGMINIGLSSNSIEKKDYCLTRANTSAKHLLGLINDILDMSKIEADKLELANSIFDLEKSIINIHNMLQPKALEKEINFVISLDPCVPSLLLGDELRFSQIVTNIATNAIKFTPKKGKVIIKTKLLAETEENIEILFTVTDTGIGISKEQQQKLFTSFNQANAQISQNFGGTGLGLAISKRIVELMHGKIWIDSEIGEGSTFSFTLVFHKVESQNKVRLAPEINVNEISILVVDDQIETLEYFANICAQLNIKCDVASSGAEALKLIENAQNSYLFYFIDWLMPIMSGIVLAKYIKSIVHNEPIIILMSAYDYSSVLIEAKEVGIHSIIPKPLFSSSIIKTINSCLSKNESLEFLNEHHEFSAPDLSPYHILIAEDIEINQEVLSAILDETNVGITYANNGEIAYHMFVNNMEKYDLILMDVNMPVMNGYIATKKIREIESVFAQKIPIIAMTANVFREDIIKCLESGMSDHIGKPIERDDLIKLLSLYLVSKKEVYKWKK